MNRLAAALSALALVSLSVPALGQQQAPASGVGPVRVQLDSMPLGALATLLMRDVMAVPYVISADVLKDDRPVSVNLSMPRSELPRRVVQFLRSMGLTVTLRGGTVYVTKGGISAQVEAVPSVQPSPGFAAVPSGSPLDQPLPSAPVVPQYGVGPGEAHSGSVDPQMNEPPKPVTVALITPAHKSVFELVDLLEAMFPDLTLSARRGSDPQGGQILDRVEPDALAVSGPREVIDQAVELVRLVDKPKPTVEIRAVVFEVRTSKSRSSALSILAELGAIDIGSGVGQAPGEQFLRIATGGLRAVLSATRGDGRFRIVAEPSLAALSGTVATLNSGSQVPTVGSVTYGEDGEPLRSIVYRDSGVSLTVRPIVRGGEIELAVSQERSSFERTTTGVDFSPTLNRSSATAQIAMSPGETVAIAGLDERSEGSSSTGFLGGLLGAKERESDQGQLLLLIQADLAQQSRQGETLVTFLEPPAPVDEAEAGVDAA